MLRLSIALPAYGLHLDIGHAAMWFGLGASMQQASDKIELASFVEYHINGIDLCRNTAVWDALQTPASHLLMVDADTYHRSSGEAIADAGTDIVQMIRDADRMATPELQVDGSHKLVPIEPPKLADAYLPLQHTGVAMIAAPVRGRGGKSGVCVQKLVLERTPAGDIIKRPGEALTLGELTGKVQPVGRIGGAFIVISLDWLRTHWPDPPWFVMENAYPQGSRPSNARGEDYTFCDGIYKRNGLVLCDGRFVPSHVDRRRLVGEQT